MSVDDDDAVGYGRPPKKHRFQKNQVANPRGRPRVIPRTRQYVPRQFKRDILKLTEAPITFGPPGNERTTETIVAIMMVAINKALKGHGPSIRFVLSKHFEALQGHYGDMPSGPGGPPEEGRALRWIAWESDEDEIRRIAARRRRRKRR